MGWVKAAMSHPLADCKVRWQQEKLAQNLNGRDSGDSRDADQEIEPLADALIAAHQKQSRTAKFMDTALDGGQGTLQISDDALPSRIRVSNDDEVAGVP